MGFKDYKYIAAGIIAVAGISGLILLPADVQPSVPEPIAEPAPVTVDVPLLVHTTKSIDISAPRISAGRRKLLAGMLTQIAEQTFTDRTHQEFWIALIGVESRYESSSKSSAGAVGLGQLIPKFATGFGASCGLAEITAADVTDDYTNAFLSACQFKTLIEQFDGSIPLALAAYNSGSASNSVKNLKAGGVPVTETAGYLSKVWTSKEQVSKSP